MIPANKIQNFENQASPSPRKGKAGPAYTKKFLNSFVFNKNSEKAEAHHGHHAHQNMVNNLFNNHLHKKQKVKSLRNLEHQMLRNAACLVGVGIIFFIIGIIMSIFYLQNKQLLKTCKVQTLEQLRVDSKYLSGSGHRYGSLEDMMEDDSITLQTVMSAIRPDMADKKEKHHRKPAKETIQSNSTTFSPSIILSSSEIPYDEDEQPIKPPVTKPKLVSASNHIYGIDDSETNPRKHAKKSKKHKEEELATEINQHIQQISTKVAVWTEKSVTIAINSEKQRHGLENNTALRLQDYRDLVRQTDLLKNIGPMFLAVGLLIIVCGMVWVPVIRERFNKKRQDQAVRI